MIRTSTKDIIKPSANASIKLSTPYADRVRFAISYGGTDTSRHLPDIFIFCLTKDDARILANDIHQAITGE